jgi:RNA polymerase sigma factor (TIGR02999 family)
MNTIGDLFDAMDRGDPAAGPALFAALYDELHALAATQLRRAGGDITLGTTTLLHEAYLKLSAREGGNVLERGRFLGYASKVFRGLVIDYIRARQAKKRGGDFEITLLGNRDAGTALPAVDPALERLASGLEELAEVDPDLSRLVDLHVFGGFTLAEIAQLEGWSLRTTERSWRQARLLLRRLMDGAEPGVGGQG